MPEKIIAYLLAKFQEMAQANLADAEAHSSVWLAGYAQGIMVVATLLELQLHLYKEEPPPTPQPEPPSVRLRELYTELWNRRANAEKAEKETSKTLAKAKQAGYIEGLGIAIKELDKMVNP